MLFFFLPRFIYLIHFNHWKLVYFSMIGGLSQIILAIQSYPSPGLDRQTEDSFGISEIKIAGWKSPWMEELGRLQSMGS